MRACLHVLLPLLLGAAVYVLFREDAVRFVAWLGLGGMADTLPGGRPQGPAWLLHQLPDAAWGYALGAALGLVWRQGPPTGRTLWLAAGLALTLGVELGQAAAVWPGRFDLVDLVISAVAYCSAVLVAAPAPLGARLEAPAERPCVHPS